MNLRLSVFALAVAGLLIMVTGASAATVRISVNGSVTTGAVDPAVITIAAASDVNEANPTGALTMTFPAPPANATGLGASLTTFHGDVSAGCLRVQGNRAVVVGHLPLNEQYDITGFGHIEWVAATLEDNGVATGSPIDRAHPFVYQTTTGTRTCFPGFPAYNNIWTQMNNPPATGGLMSLDSGDAGFGYTDQLDGFPGNPDSTVSVVHPNGLSVAITDRPDGGSGKGLNVVVGAGSGAAEFLACGFTLIVPAGGQDVVTCGSLILEVVTGSAEVVLDDLTSVSISTGGMAEIADNGDGSFSVENLGTVEITVVVDGVEATIEPGDASTLEAWDFQGFSIPVDAAPTLNVVKAGAAVPLKWRVLDTAGSPVTGIASAGVSVSSLDCTSGEGSDVLEQTATAGSGLQNLGNGYYQLNWKTQKAYAGSCKALHLDIGDGVTHDAYFDFRK